MAGKLKLGPQALDLSFIFSFPTMNYRQLGEGYGTDNEKKAMQKELAINGWLGNNAIDVIEISEDQLAEAMVRLEGKWEDLKSKAKSSVEDFKRLTMFEQIYVKNEKLVQPKVVNNDGFRRLSLYLDALVERTAMDKGLLGGDTEVLPRTIPVNVVAYDSEVERIAAQVQDNERDGLGRKEVPMLDKLLAAKPLFEAGFTENAFRRVFKVGTAQKLYAVLNLNARVPAARLYDRLTTIKDPTDPQYVNLGGLDPNVIRPVLTVGKGKEKTARIPTLEEVNTIIVGANTGEGKPDPVADKNTIRNLATNNPSPWLKLFVQGYDAANFTKVAPIFASTAACSEEILKWQHKQPELLAYLQAFKG